MLFQRQSVGRKKGLRPISTCAKDATSVPLTPDTGSDASRGFKNTHLKPKAAPKRAEDLCRRAFCKQTLSNVKMNPTNTLAAGFASGLEVTIQQNPPFSLPQLPERSRGSPATQSKATLRQQALAAAGKSPTWGDALGWHGTKPPALLESPSKTVP